VTAGAYIPPPPMARARRRARERGIARAVAEMAAWGAGYAAGFPVTFTGSRRAFRFDGADYRYLYHRHGFTWLNERAVEVPIVARTVAEARGRRVLEVGNVLAHYGHGGHPVVDKYERAPGVLNVDALDYAPSERYDLVVSVSTLEHIGWDEAVREPSRAERSVAALARHLRPGGTMLVTLPVGYHPVLDEAIRAGRVEFTTLRALRRTGRTTWEQAEPAEVWHMPYDQLLCAANAILVGTVTAARSD
jgi:SAM-dependent methyltransferase